MSREIKFRVWDKKNKKMHSGNLAICLQHKDGGCTYPNQYIHGDFPMIYGFGGTLELQQFTGLRDVNGVEIWEFDLLQDSMGKIAVVTWFKSNAEFELLDAEEAIFNGLDCEEPPYQIDTSGGWVKLKVIGNVFEHPHLLDEAK